MREWLEEPKGRHCRQGPASGWRDGGELPCTGENENKTTPPLVGPGGFSHLGVWSLIGESRNLQLSSIGCVLRLALEQKRLFSRGKGRARSDVHKCFPFSSRALKKMSPMAAASQRCPRSRQCSFSQFVLVSLCAYMSVPFGTLAEDLCLRLGPFLRFQQTPLVLSGDYVWSQIFPCGL